MTSTSAKVVFHVGYGSTGTTFLQNVIFPQLPGILYFAEPMGTPQGMCYREPMIDRYRFGRSLELKEAIHAKLHERLSRQGAAGKTVLISNEGYTLEPLASIHSLANLFPEATILLTIRSPFDLVLARYRGRVKRLKEKDSLSTCLNNFNVGWWLEQFHFMNRIRALEAVFSNVHVAVFEEYITDLDSFLSFLYTSVFGQPSPVTRDIGQKDETGTYKNESIGMLYPLARVLCRQRDRMPPATRMWFLQFLERSNRFLCGHKGFQNLNRRLVASQTKTQRALIVERTEKVFIPANKELEQYLGRSLPDKYFR